MSAKDFWTYETTARTKVIVRGAGDMASGVAYLLHRNGFRVCLTELAKPLAIRRLVSFCEAVYDGEKTIEEVTAKRVSGPEDVFAAWNAGNIPLLVDPSNTIREFLKPQVLVDATMAKRNIGTTICDAPLVIGLGPGLSAGVDVDVVIETNQGLNLGKLIFQGAAEPDTKIPELINGYGEERVIRAPGDGVFKVVKNIGEMVREGEPVAYVGDKVARAKISGILRGILRDGTGVMRGLKAGEVDPRGEISYCTMIFDKAISLGLAVIEAIVMMLPQTMRENETHYNWNFGCKWPSIRY